MPLILSLNLVTNEGEEFFFFPIVDHFDRWSLLNYIWKSNDNICRLLEIEVHDFIRSHGWDMSLIGAIVR
jgi:hypothetical protein